MKLSISHIIVAIVLTQIVELKAQELNYKPQMVVPGVISSEFFEGHASITPDGNEIYYTIYNNDHSFSTIVYSKKVDGHWTLPKITSFSGMYSDGSPALSPNGKRLYFSSKRPTTNSTHKNDNDIWYVERIGSHWSAPIWIKSVNTAFNEFSSSIDRKGNFYFCSNRPEGYGDMDVYYSQKQQNTFSNPILLDKNINSKYQEGNVGVSPDGNLLFVMVQHQPGDFGYDDIHFSKKRNNTWTPLKNVGSIINTKTYDFSPKVSPDGDFLYFSSRINRDYTNKTTAYTFETFVKNLQSPYNGLGNIYKIAIRTLKLD